MKVVLAEEAKARASPKTTSTVPGPEAKDQESAKDQELASQFQDQGENDDASKRSQEPNPEELLPRKSRRLHPEGSDSDYSKSSGHDSDDNLDG